MQRHALLSCSGSYKHTSYSARGWHQATLLIVVLDSCVLRFDHLYKAVHQPWPSYLSTLVPLYEAVGLDTSRIANDSLELNPFAFRSLVVGCG